MHIAVAADHGGFELKEQIVAMLRQEGHDVLDFGTHTPERTDYPDYALLVGQAIQQGRAERGILICGSGVGISIAANKMRGIRAAICHDTYSARQGVEHDDMNVLALGGRVIGTALAFEIVRAFLSAQFLNRDQYLARLQKVLYMEQERAS